MKLSNKVFLSIGLGWLAFFGLSYLIFLLFHNQPFYLFSLSLLLGTLLVLFGLGLMIIFTLKPLAEFKRRVKELHKQNTQLKNRLHEHEQAKHELIIYKERLVKLAHYDYLTSLPNRIYFNEFFTKALNYAKQHNQILAILFINLDHFKHFNSQYKRRVGNHVLKDVTQRFKNTLGADDIIARFGGDEFIVLLNEIENPKIISATAEKLLKACRIPIKVSTNEVVVTASIGIAIFPSDGNSLEELQRHADVAMYRAKKSGGDTYRYYRQTMDISDQEPNALVYTLRHAILNNEFALYYQPQLSLKSGKIKSVEALIRWQHPDLGLLGTEKFLKYAEENGMIMDLSEFILNTACMTNKSWQQEGYDPVMVSVNISASEIHQQDILKLVEAALNKSGLQPGYLCIEVPEAAILENADITLQKLKNIQALGVKIALDDFGTAGTSANYLKQIAVNILKIDQAFIKGLPLNENDLAVTNSVIALGHQLGLEIVAEGVETTEQIQYLAEHNCDLIQGYFLSRPLPGNKITLQFSKRGKIEDTIVAHQNSEYLIDKGD